MHQFHKHDLYVYMFDDIASWAIAHVAADRSFISQ